MVSSSNGSDKCRCTVVSLTRELEGAALEIPERPDLAPHGEEKEQVPEASGRAERGRSTDEWGPLDEFGLPVAWRREEREPVSDIEDAWRVFETWATARRFKPFPADLLPVALFLSEAPVSGAQLREVWEAIDQYHCRMYWHEGANPVLELQLGYGVRVSEDGVVTVEGSTSPPPDD